MLMQPLCIDTCKELFTKPKVVVFLYVALCSEVDSLTAHHIIHMIRDWRQVDITKSANLNDSVSMNATYGT